MAVPKTTTLQHIARLNAKVSGDGRSARFTIVVKTGQSLSFAVPCSRIGILIQAFQSVARTMRARLSCAPEGDGGGSIVAEGLTEPAPVSSLAFARDAATGDTLLWIETEDGGTYPLRLGPNALATLRDAWRLHEDVAVPAREGLNAAAE